MKLNWIFRKPIDFEYNQYVFLDFCEKAKKEFSELKIYPTFQEVSLHLANVSLIKNKNQFLKLKKKIQCIDQEITLGDLQYLPIRLSDEELLEVQQSSRFAEPQLKDLFQMGKSLWSLAFDSVSLDLFYPTEALEWGYGYFFFYLNNKTYLYEYNIDKNPQSLVTECTTTLVIVSEIKNIKKLIKSTNTHQGFGGVHLPVFHVVIGQKFPFEETIFPIAKRKVQNYVIQSAKLKKHI